MLKHMQNRKPRSEILTDGHGGVGRLLQTQGRSPSPLKYFETMEEKLLQQLSVRASRSGFWRSSVARSEVSCCFFAVDCLRSPKMLKVARPPA